MFPVRETIVKINSQPGIESNRRERAEAFSYEHQQQRPRDFTGAVDMDCLFFVFHDLEELHRGLNRPADGAVLRADLVPA